MKILIAFCFVCHHLVEADDGGDGEGNNDHHQQEERYHPMKDKRYLQEIEDGDMADLFSTNIHKAIPVNYAEFGRRFVPQYPYVEKSPEQIDDEAEERLDKAIRKALTPSKSSNDIIPLRAPPSLVLAVAKQSLLRQQSQPVDSQEFVEKQALRSGNYWNGYWKEEAPTGSAAFLRTQDNSLKSLRVKILPGSKLYELVSMARSLSPKLLYVMHDYKPVYD